MTSHPFPLKLEKFSIGVGDRFGRQATDVPGKLEFPLKIQAGIPQT